MRERRVVNPPPELALGAAKSRDDGYRGIEVEAFILRVLVAWPDNTAFAVRVPVVR